MKSTKVAPRLHNKLALKRMNMAKKIFYSSIATTALFLFFSGSVFAQDCNTFDFPLIQNNNILFFNCDSGELQKFDAQNKLSSVPGQKSLGGFVHSLAWSPDGSRALVLAEECFCSDAGIRIFLRLIESLTR